jgi:hypothetical protein
MNPDIIRETSISNESSLLHYQFIQYVTIALPIHRFTG